MKEYKLLKDLPRIKAGTIISIFVKKDSFHEMYINEQPPLAYEYDYLMEILDNKEWFEKLEN